jgi:hypothetical protein
MSASQGRCLYSPIRPYGPRDPSIQMHLGPLRQDGMGFSSFMLGLAAGFLITATMSFAFHGLFGLYYLIAAGISAGVSVLVTLGAANRASRAEPR